MPGAQGGRAKDSEESEEEVTTRFAISVWPDICPILDGL